MPGTPQLHTVFDTNIYRGLSLTALETLLPLEAAAGIEPLASLWPCLELLAHCGTPHDPAYGPARGALSKLSRHAGYQGVDGLRIRMHEDGESSLVRGLFGQTLDDRLLEHGFAAGLIREALTKEPAAFLADNQQELAAVAARVEAEEHGFAQSFQAIATVPPALRAPVRGTIRSADGLRLIAKTRIATLATQVQVPVAEPRLGEFVDRVLEAYPVPMHFLQDLFADALTSNIDFGKARNRNSVWDLKIAFHAAAGAAVQGVPVLLVPDDPRLLRAAESAGVPYRVASLEAYTRLLHDDGIAARVNVLRGTA